MSRKNRNQRRGYSGLNALVDGTVINGALGELFDAIGGPVTSASSTNALEYMYTRMLFRISLSRFTWKGLPDTVSRRWLELCLASQALAVFFEDPQTGQYFATQGTPSGNYNMVGDPTAFRAVAANNMKWWELPIGECVPIWANEMRVRDMDIIRIYAHTLAEADRTIQINLKNARQPKVLAYPQNMQMTVDNMLQQIEGGSNAIKVTSEFGQDIEKIFQVLDLSIHPDLILNTSIMRNRIFGEAMTMLGVNNAPNSDKKERLVAAEVSGNDDVIETIRETNLEARKVACDQINDMFGLNVSVEYTTDLNQTALKDTGSVPELTEGQQ